LQVRHETPKQTLKTKNINLFTVAIAVLAYYDGRTSPTLPLGITLNTAIALFVTLARGAFMAPIVEGFGQLKWTRFVGREPRPLIDFQCLDQASRGPWGSFMVLAKCKG
jgi:hypothetical protein